MKLTIIDQSATNRVDPGANKVPIDMEYCDYALLEIAYAYRWGI